MGLPGSINSRGYRDAGYSLAKPAGTYRIIALGDSTTFGWGVPIEQTAAKILEHTLNQTAGTGYGRFEVINAGVGNYGSVQEVAHYRTFDQALHPDAVVLDYFINDPEPVLRERGLGTLGQSYLLAFAISRFDTLSRLTGIGAAIGNRITPGCIEKDSQGCGRPRTRFENWRPSRSATAPQYCGIPSGVAPDQQGVSL